MRIDLLLRALHVTERDLDVLMAHTEERRPGAYRRRCVKQPDDMEAVSVTVEDAKRIGP